MCKVGMAGKLFRAHASHAEYAFPHVQKCKICDLTTSYIALPKLSLSIQKLKQCLMHFAVRFLAVCGSFQTILMICTYTTLDS